MADNYYDAEVSFRKKWGITISYLLTVKIWSTVLTLYISLLQPSIVIIWKTPRKAYGKLSKVPIPY
jgi:hypothetical protein